ncbi:uncharacterized protein LOC134207185 [Armigeres subalbatus]|uniref:uncharacterized protein LOC134207185 n=1 Tax=Armigeres subalbatus TaxID=124917 RepID=UPI002ED1E6A6
MREKTSKLREHIKRERGNLEMPISADHVIEQENHVQHCQSKLQYINDRVRKGLEKEDTLDLAICRSKLLHYRSRLQLITERNLTGYVRKLEEGVETSLHRINDFFADTTMLDVPDAKPSEEDRPILPDDAEILERLKNAQLQSSVKSNNIKQPSHQHFSAEQHLDQMRHIQQQQLLLQKQIELQRIQQEHLEKELKIQQQFHNLRLQQEKSHDESFCTDQNNVLLQPPSIDPKNVAPGAAHRAAAKSHGDAHKQAGGNSPLPAQTKDPDTPNILQQSNQHHGEPLRSPWRIHAPIRQPLNNTANDCSRYPQPPESRLPNRSPQNRMQNYQPVYKWPFEYAGQANTIRLGEFLNMVTTYAITEGVDETTLLRSIKHLLKGSALQWYTRCYMHLRDWNEFKLEIKREFLPPNYSEIVKQDLYLRFQEPNEPFASFYRDVVAAFEIVEPPLLESEKLFILKSHLNADFTPIATAARVTSVKELVAVCRDFAVSRSYGMRNRSQGQLRSGWSRNENPTFNRSTRPSPSGQQYGRQQLNTIARDLNEQIEETPHREILEHEESSQQLAIQWEEASMESEEINAIRMQPPWSRNQETTREIPNTEARASMSTVITCWQCGNQGHTYPTCPNPKTFVFCYSCGKKGATTRSCQQCAARWTQLAAANRKHQSGNQ